MKTSKSTLSFAVVCAAVASLHGVVPETGRWADYTIDEVRISEGILPTSSFLRFRAALGTTVFLR